MPVQNFLWENITETMNWFEKENLKKKFALK